jgi:hypothetical protein
VRTRKKTTCWWRPRLPAVWTVARTRRAILAVHPALKNAWGRRLGYRLMFTASEILIAVLQDLATRDIPALGLHDGLIVARSKMEVAKEVMMRRGEELTGIIIPVSEKLSTSPPTPQAKSNASRPLAWTRT